MWDSRAETKDETTIWIVQGSTFYKGTTLNDFMQYTLPWIGISAVTKLPNKISLTVTLTNVQSEKSLLVERLIVTSISAFWG